MLKPTPMLKFRIIAPSEYEDRVVEALVRVGMVHLTRSEGLERGIPKELLLVAERKVELAKIDVDKITSLIGKLCGEAVEYAERSEKLRSEIHKLERLVDSLRILAKLGLRTDSFGHHGFIFVTAGFIKKEYEAAMRDVLYDLKVAFNVVPLNTTHSLVIVSGLIRQEAEVEDALAKLAFEKLKFPPDLDPDPLKAFTTLNYELQRLREELAEIASELITHLREAEEREKTERIALFDKFLRLYERYRDIALRIADLLSQEGLEPPEELQKALERYIIAEKIEIQDLMDLINEYEEAVSDIEARIEKVTSTLRTLGNVKERLGSVESEVAKEVESHIITVREELLGLTKEISSAMATLAKYEPYIRAMRYAKDSISRLRIFRKHYVSIVSGWIPVEYSKTLETTVKELVPRVIELKMVSPSHEENVPVLVKSKGIVKYFLTLTLSRDIPSYWEINPMPFFTVLFLVMYGMMFGDIGLGPTLIALGLLAYKANRPFLGISANGLKTLGVLMVFGGISSTFFGFLYGVFFLQSIFKPILLSPLHDLYGIMKVALMFGIAQLILSMLLNIVNGIIEKDPYEIFLSGRGLVGLTYYIAGIYIAMVLASSGFNWSLLLKNPNHIATFTALGCMGAVALGPIFNYFTKGESISSCMIDGFTELLEMLIAYPANSLSYIRLAAFAIAHEAFGLLAESLASSIGLIPSLILANLLVLVIEGFAVGIQALRLVYYEFSTKFLRGGGTIYKPMMREVLGGT